MLFIGLLLVVVGVGLFLGLVGALPTPWLSLALRGASEAQGFCALAGAAIVFCAGLFLIIVAIVNMVSE